MNTKKLAIGAALVTVSSTSAHAGLFDWFWGFLYKKHRNEGRDGGSGGKPGAGHSVPEIDAMAGMASLAIVICLALVMREKFFRR